MKYFIVLAALLPIILFSQENEIIVRFGVDDHQLDQNSKRDLLELAANNRARAIHITGAADTTGNKAYNQLLSEKRANVVKKFLIDNGLSSTYVENSTGIGESSKHGELSENRVAIIKFTVLPATEKPPIKDKERDWSAEKIEDSNDDHIAKTKDGALDQNTIESLEVGDILNIGGVEFLPGRHVLTKASKPALKKLITIMEDNPELVIEIQGHICCQTNRDGFDKDTGTMNLSENRAITIYKALTKAGISKDRLTYKGYGPFRKLVKEVDDASRQRNRRVSIQILER